MSENESASDNKSILLREDSNGICTLTLNRPEKRNALSSDLLTALQEAFDELADDKSIKVIILAANGPVFSSGHDLNEVRTDSSYAVMHALFEQCSDVMITMKKQPQPIIAKVHGTAMAAGCQLMANCDLAVATETAKFALPGSSIGLFCSTPAVAVGRVTSTKHAMEMLLTGEAMDAPTAYRFGLINRHVPNAALDSTVMDFAELIARKSSYTLRVGKEAFYRQQDMDLEQAYVMAAEVMVQNMLAEDAHEGMTAFIEKREPVWRDR